MMDFSGLGYEKVFSVDERVQAVSNHYKWLNAERLRGC